MATPVDPQFQDRLQALRNKYAASVPERMLAVSNALQQCLHDGQTPANLEILRDSLHTVAGSSGSFGFRELGERSAAADQLVRGMIAGKGEWLEIVLTVKELLLWADKAFTGGNFNTHD